MTTPRTFTYATRRSNLALAQCRSFIDRVREAHGTVLNELQIVTSGDQVQDRPLSEIGGKGLFVKEIEEALKDGRADLAVHSVKDVPGALPLGLFIACIPMRADPRDVVISPKFGTLAALPPGAKVGTSSLRRAAAVKQLRPDLAIVPLRGNVDTRIRKVDAGECDAILLAFAGLLRLRLESRVTEILAPEQSLPAVGQGALGIECREDDEETIALLAPFHDVTTGVCVAAERGVMIALEGDCRTPIAAYAEKTGGALRLRAFSADPDGSNVRKFERVRSWPDTTVDAEAFGLEVGLALRA